MVDDIERYEVLRGEIFSHSTEPIISFARKSVWINMGCLKCMPNTTYVHFLLLRQARKLIIKHSTEESLDTVRWCTHSGKPRKILCDAEFWNDLTALMDWNDQYRYKLLGRFVHSSDWDGLAFDMTRAERIPIAGTAAPCKYYNSQTLEEHIKNPLVKRFTEDTSINTNEAE